MQSPKRGASALLAAAVVLILALPASGADSSDPGPDGATASPTEGASEPVPPAAAEPTSPPGAGEPTSPPETVAAPPTATPVATPLPDAPTAVASAPTETEPSSVGAAATPTGSISGRVTVPAGADVTTVWVDVGRMDLSGHAGYTYVRADGTYTVEALPPGRYFVEFVGWTAGLLQEVWNDTPYLGDATAVVVDTGAVTGIDATLARGGVLSGTIRSNSDCDLSYVDVYAWGAPGQPVPNSIVKADGTWSVTSLPTGTYWIEFDGRYTGLPRTFWNITGNPYGISEASVTAGQTRGGIDITLDGPRGCVPARPYVFQVYADLLDRNPDQSGMDTWSRALAAGAPRASVANAITASDEYRSRLIRATYQRYLGRYAEPAGLATWLGQMRAGVRIEDIQAGFVASDEFWRRHGSTREGWVTGLYGTVLGRTPSSAEVRWWASRMAGGASRGDVARGFLYSTEYLTTVVDGYYVDVLGRHIDPSGKATWVRLIQQGHRDEQIVAGILSSEEYGAKVRRLFPST